VNAVRSALWSDASELPESLSESLQRAEGHAELASALADPTVSRVVVSGNGASWYVANAMWPAALGSDIDVEVLTVPAGTLAGGGFRWRDGDFLLFTTTPVLLKSNESFGSCRGSFRPSKPNFA
jgi:hypothetical protein